MQSWTEMFQRPLIPPRTHLWNGRRLIRLTWNEVCSAIDHIANRIRIDHFQPDVIIGISRGGLIPAVMLSHELDVRRVKVVEARYYDTGYYPRRLSPRPIVEKIDLLESYRLGLLVDDISGTGDTISEVKSRLVSRVGNIKTATLVRNKNCEIDVDYYFVTVDDFVVFPWEDSTRQLKLESATQERVNRPRLKPYG